MSICRVFWQYVLSWVFVYCSAEGEWHLLYTAITSSTYCTVNTVYTVQYFLESQCTGFLNIIQFNISPLLFQSSTVQYWNTLFMLCNVKCKALSFLLYQKMEEKKIYQDHHIPTTADITRLTPKGSPRFGSLSHHSFFSRHNPHPHRVTHIPGEYTQALCFYAYIVQGQA